MNTSGSSVDEASESWAITMPGRMAGRQVDGVELIIDGVSHGWSPPRWERLLLQQGWSRDRDGPVSFEVQLPRETAVRTFLDVRTALRCARTAVEAGRDCWDVILTAVTSNNLRVRIVTGTPIVGMAIGALEDEQIRVIDGPAWLPPYPPGEEPRRRHRTKHSAMTRG
jgi:hypothetical protein